MKFRCTSGRVSCSVLLLINSLAPMGIQLENDVSLWQAVSLQREYWDQVVSYLITEAKEGRTPNPDIMCNSRIKFGMFYDYVGKHFGHVATGHYASTEKGPDGKPPGTHFVHHGILLPNHLGILRVLANRGAVARGGDLPIDAHYRSRAAYEVTRRRQRPDLLPVQFEAEPAHQCNVSYWKL